MMDLSFMACCRVKSGLTGHRLCGALGLVGFVVCSSRRFQASGFSGLSEDKGARHSILSGYSQLKPRPRDMLLQISTPAKNWRGRRPYLIYGTHPDQGSWQQASIQRNVLPGSLPCRAIRARVTQRSPTGSSVFSILQSTGKGRFCNNHSNINGRT